MQERWRALERVLKDHYHEADIQATRALLAAIAAHRLTGVPVWPMIVGPPGSLKTVLVSSLRDAPNCHLIDRLTPHTFLSGQIVDATRQSLPSPSLLHRIGKQGIIIYPDFSTILSMNRDHRASVLADMRRIYDGHLRREFGTAENVEKHEWSGRITFAVAATPDVDRHYSVFQSLGERFIMIRVHRPGGVAAALRAMNQDSVAAGRDLASAVLSLLGGILAGEPRIPEHLQLGLAALGEFAARARTHVPRESDSKKTIIVVPEAEAATRLPQQLAQVAKGSAILGGRSEVNKEDLELAARVALDCIPATRRTLLDAARNGKDLSTVQLPRSTRQYAIEELEALGLLKSLPIVSSYVLSNEAAELLVQAGLRPE